MAGEMGEKVRRFYEAWSAGDVDSMLALLDPEIAAEPVLGLLYQERIYQGHAGIREWFEEVQGKWDRFETRVRDVREVGDDVAVAFVHIVAETDGQELDAQIAVNCLFRDGLILSFVGRDADEAAEDLGLV